MAKGYWIARIDVDDMEKYKKYIAANAAPLAEYGGKFLVRGGDRQEKEGNHRSRNVVIEFESYQKAIDCYNSPGYQAAIELRTAVSQSDTVIIEGYDGPQPGDD
ncbi:MAG: DUF1330 domain-containing protein [Alphaproteobacteria bacterium]|nr:DUF1330 domain-containing protein [Alphaproteobacteria bacterium]